MGLFRKPPKETSSPSSYSLLWEQKQPSDANVCRSPIKCMNSFCWKKLYIIQYFKMHRWNAEIWYAEMSNDIEFDYLPLCLLHLSLLVRSSKYIRSLFQPWLHCNKELLSPLWQSLCVRPKTPKRSCNLQPNRQRKIQRMPGSRQKRLQLYPLQIQPVLIQWGLPATSAGAIWGNVTQHLFISIFQWPVRHCVLFGELHKQTTGPI